MLLSFCIFYLQKSAGKQRNARTLCLQPEPSLFRVLCEHFYGIKLKRFQLHTDQLERFVQNVVSHRNNIASASVCLNNVQNLTNTYPTKLQRSVNPRSTLYLLLKTPSVPTVLLSPKVSNFCEHSRGD